MDGAGRRKGFAMRTENCGIYEIVSPSGNRYVGSAVDFARRRMRHKKDLRKGRHHNAPLQRAWDKYGEAAMVFRVIVVCAPEDILMYEQIAIDGLKPEYNVARTAGSRIGVRHTDATRAKMSVSQTGKKMSPESIAKTAAALRGRKGPPATPERKAKVAEAIRRWCAANPGARKSKRHTTDTKKKIAEGLRRAYKDGRR